ncbi:hypothetical protein [Bradyrhizobium sp. Gha]|uniref:hypothetical protein n=1 Tax=Bradyrhizobium sp. Gha TaxID=1855318 RepID=UPI0008E08015|nr:hypothetical protein [Bradyrhizobium sp. Gha]SFJ71873.1 hypothetical protein SAMN05216525_13318 [Bradyrhizobium sp. Gha]
MPKRPNKRHSIAPKRREKPHHIPAERSSQISTPQDFPWFVPLSEPVRPLAREEIADIRREEGDEGRNEALADQAKKAGAAAAKSKHKRRQVMLAIVQEEEAGATDTKRSLLDNVNARLLAVGLQKIKLKTLYRWRDEVRRLRK